jgi:hypothetical protein
MRDQTWASNHIQQAYDRLGYDLGWRLLGCSWANLATAKVALITLNPGGSQAEPDMLTYEDGCIYLSEKWQGRECSNHPLQLQIQRLFELARVHGDKVLSGYLVPFRSPTWAALKAPQEARQFGVEMWRCLLDGRSPRLTFTIGDVVFQSMQDILKGSDATEHASGWGNVKIKLAEYEGGHLIGLPHLSRYRLFGKKARALAREESFRTFLRNSAPAYSAA